MSPHDDDVDNGTPLSNRSFRIRSMAETDIPKVNEIEKLTYGDQSWPLEELFIVLTDPIYSCWILEDINDPTLILGFGFQRYIDDMSHITNLCIHPNRRSEGLGGLLLRHMITHAQIYGAIYVTLEVKISNLHAYHLYVKHGFTIIEYLEKYYSEFDDGYRMNLPIQ